MLEVKDVNQFYGGSHILRDVSLTAPVGECSVVLGRNGVGKTTLKCLMGILPIKSGQILLDGKDIAKMSLSNECVQVWLMCRKDEIFFQP
jgi:urea transport system ATP-binding protein